jgi:glucan phosphoethanolaminetransferase (alkaline phosphatase superfamily)
MTSHGGEGANWQIIGASLAVFLAFIISTCLGIFVSVKCPKKSMEAVFSILLVFSIIIPIVYFVLGYKASGLSLLSRNLVLAFTLVTYILLLLSCSLGIWIASINQNWSSTTQKNGIRITMIVLLVLGIILPLFWMLFHYRKEICEKIVPTSSTSKGEMTPLKKSKLDQLEEENNAA